MASRVLVPSLILLLGCDPAAKGGEPAATQAATAVSTSAASGASASAAPSAAAKDALREDDVRDLVSRWQSTQNEGRFEAYAALFAERFVGEKRVGNRSMRFDRKRWLEDRGELFKKPFTVQVDDLGVVMSERSALVRFRQTWSNANFRDTGMKHLVVVREGGVLKIASEEMLDSKTADEAAPAAPDPRAFSLLAPEKSDVLWIETLPDLNAVSGHPEFVSADRATRPVTTSALPEVRRKLVGERFQVYGEDGPVCQGVVKEFLVDIAVEPHFGIMAQWEGGEGAPPVPLLQRALELWQISEFGTRVLAARLELDGKCEGGIWARAAALPAPAVWKARAATAEETDALWKAVRGHGEFTEIQKEYVRVAHKSTPWDETSVSREFKVFDDGKGSVYAAITLNSQFDDSCASEFDPSLWLLLKRHGSGFRVVSAPMGEHVDSAWPRSFDPLHVDAAFDLDGDGVPEFASSSDLVQSVGGSFRATFNLSPSYHSCPC